MTLTYGGAGTGSSGSGGSPALTPGAPSISGAGYRNFLCVTWKPSSIDADPVVTTTAGAWKHISTAYNTTDVASSADHGSMRTAVWYVDGECPTATNVKFAGTIGAAQAVIVNYVNSDPDNYSIAHNLGWGEQNTEGANYSAPSTVGGNIFLESGDTVVAITGTNTDGGTPSAPTFASSGVTFGTPVFSYAAASTTGDDGWLGVVTAAVTGGTETTTTTYSHTNATASQGTTVFIGLKLLSIPTITVTPTADFYINPGYIVHIAGLSSYHYFQVDRHDETGLERAPIRGFQYQPILRSSYTITDYEFRFGAIGCLHPRNQQAYNLSVYYSGQRVAIVIAEYRSPLQDYVDAIDTDFTGDNSLPDGMFAKSFLGVPEIPELNIPVLIGSLETHKSPGNVLSTSHVLGRSNPVVATDVVGGFSGDFTVLVSNGLSNSSYGCPTNVKAYEDLFSRGNVLQLRNVSPLSAGVEDFYFIVTELSMKRENVVAPQLTMVQQARRDPNALLGVGYQPVILLTVSYQRVDAPSYNSVIPSFTWQTLLEGFATWQDVLDTFPSWLSVLQTTDGDFG